MSIGQSEYTHEKQEVLRMILAVHMRIVKGILSKKPRLYPRYVYADLNAGAGFNDAVGVVGSPIVAAQEADRLGLPIDLTLFERDAETRSRLVERLTGRNDVNVYGDHNDHWRDLFWWHQGTRQGAYGLCYWDPNAATIPIEVINGLICKPLDAVDVLLHVNANGGYKRAQAGRPAGVPRRYLADDVLSLDKRHWWIREPRLDWQWTFLIGSNWDGFPEFRRKDFHALYSPAGLRILERLNLSERERKEGWPRLPFEIQPTGPTPNTSGIRASAPSGRSSSSAPAASASDAGVARQLSLII